MSFLLYIFIFIVLMTVYSNFVLRQIYNLPLVITYSESPSVLYLFYHLIWTLYIEIETFIIRFTNDFPLLEHRQNGLDSPHFPRSQLLLITKIIYRRKKRHGDTHRACFYTRWNWNTLCIFALSSQQRWYAETPYALTGQIVGKVIYASSMRGFRARCRTRCITCILKFALCVALLRDHECLMFTRHTHA